MIDSTGNVSRWLKNKRQLFSQYDQHQSHFEMLKEYDDLHKISSEKRSVLQMNSLFLKDLVHSLYDKKSESCYLFGKFFLVEGEVNSI